MDIKVLDSIEKMSNVNDDIKLEVEKFVPTLVDYLSERSVNFSENTMIGFVTHSIALLDRIKKGEKIDDLGSEIIKQIDPKCIELSRGAFKIIENEYNIQLDESEIILGAIHIMNALQDNK